MRNEKRWNTDYSGEKVGEVFHTTECVCEPELDFDLRFDYISKIFRNSTQRSI
jgi:hypothetical protein